MTGDDFTDRVVLVSGGARGIGYAMAQAFLQCGARVAICATDVARLKQALTTLTALGDVDGGVADVRDYAQASQWVNAMSARFGRVDILVNNAGRVWVGEFSAQPVASIDDVIATNLNGTLYLTRLVLPSMLARGSGVIVNVASGAGLAGIPELATYCATKFGVVGFTESVAREVARRDVRLYAVCPGAVATDMQVQYSGHRVGMPPQRVAEAIVQLAGTRAPVTSGGYLEL